MTSNSFFFVSLVGHIWVQYAVNPWKNITLSICLYRAISVTLVCFSKFKCLKMFIWMITSISVIIHQFRSTKHDWNILTMHQGKSIYCNIDFCKTIALPNNKHGLNAFWFVKCKVVKIIDMLKHTYSIMHWIIHTHIYILHSSVID